MRLSEDAYTADGLDDALIGIDTRGRAVYSVEKVIEILSIDMSEEEAVEFFDFNIAGAYLGEMTPVFVYFDMDEENEYPPGSTEKQVVTLKRKDWLGQVERIAALEAAIIQVLEECPYPRYGELEKALRGG